VHFIDGGHGKVALMGMQILKAPNYKTNWLLHALSESWLKIPFYTIFSPKQ
jgi:hypothetical protein